MADTTFTHGPSNVTTLLATTIENRRKGIQDAIFDEIPTLKLLKQKGAIIEGGATIVLPLLYETNSTAQFYNGYEQLDTTPQDGHTTAQYKWKEAAVSISVSNREENIQNVGPSAVESLVDAKIKQATYALKDLLNSSLYAASPGTNDIGSLATTIDATSSIGDINSTTYSWWQSDINASGSFAAQGRSDMLTLYNALVVEGARPDILVTTPTVHAYYEGSLVPQQRYESNGTGNASFKELMFKNAQVIFDNDATSGVMYFLDSRHLQLYTSSGNNMKMTEWVKPANQTAKVAQLITACELVTNNRRRLGALTGITA
jgi:hypothetical protein